jgi:hypothetical protein
VQATLEPGQRSASTEDAWITLREAAQFERITIREVYRRTKPGDPRFLISKRRREMDGKPGLLIHARSMTPDAQARWHRRALQQIGESSAVPPAQLDLTEKTDVDRQIEALNIPRSEKALAVRRFHIVDLCLNHNWKKAGFPSKHAFLKTIAKREQTHVRTIQRWVFAWKQPESLTDLLNDRPGPERGSGSALDADMRAHLIDCWSIKKLTLAQCYRSLVKYLEDKQNSPGCRVDWHYPIPSRATVGRYIRSLDPCYHAMRRGEDALKETSGHLCRTYRDLRSLERVETDEWKCDFFCYLPNRPKVFKRFWLLTFYDERSMFPLVWKLVEGDRFDKRPGITVQDEIDLLIGLLRGLGVPKVISSDRGRFRGGEFGGNDRFKEADGILDSFGIEHRTPRDKNPRGARLERFHRYLADCSRTIPGWIGANDKQREMTPGDAQAAMHERWLRGDPVVSQTPLLSTQEALLKINEWMEEWRAHESEGTDMDGLSPRAVFQHNIPAEGFRKPDDIEITFKTAEHFVVSILPGGIVKLKDGKRYSHPVLTLLQGQRREVTRARHDHARISVLPAAKGQDAITAERCPLVGTNDPEQLARAMALQGRLRKLARGFVEPSDYEPGEQFSETPIKAAPMAVPQGIAAPEPAIEAPGPTPENEISSVAFLMENNRYQRMVKPMGFSDLEE